MHPGAEIGYDTPDNVPGMARPGKVARRLIIALIIGALAGLAIMLQVKGWSTLGGESGGACGTSDQGVSYGACPRGIAPALIVSFLVGLPAVPAAIALLFRKGWVRRLVVIAGLAGGLVAGQALFAAWHGTDLAVAWVAPDDSSDQLTTVGAWADGGSLIRVRVDQAVSYSAATGAVRWTLPIPGVDVACGSSGTSSGGISPGGISPGGTSSGGTGSGGGIGLIAYGSDSSTCDHVLAFYLASGREVWAEPVRDPYSGNGAIGQLAVAGGTAIVLTDDGIAGISAASGAQRWTLGEPDNCNYQQLSSSSGSSGSDSVVALAACTNGYEVVSIDPARGAVAWQYHVTEPSQSYSFQILSASPVVVDDELSGPRGASTVRVFSGAGAQTSSFAVSGIPLGSQTVELNTASNGGFAAPVAVTDGMLVGATSTGADDADAIVGYRLSDGARRWLTPTPDEVNDVSLAGDSLVFIDESDPAYSLEEVNVATGTLRSLGFFTQAVLQSGQSGLFAFPGDDVVVNTTGDSGDQPPVAAIRVPAGPI